MGARGTVLVGPPNVLRRGAILRSFHKKKPFPPWGTPPTPVGAEEAATPERPFWGHHGRPSGTPLQWDGCTMVNPRRGFALQTSQKATERAAQTPVPTTFLGAIMCWYFSHRVQGVMIIAHAKTGVFFLLVNHFQSWLKTCVPQSSAGNHPET